MSIPDLATAMRSAHPRDPRMIVSERTLYRIETHGAIPTARVKFAIAAVFGLLPSQIWGRNRSGVTR